MKTWHEAYKEVSSSLFKFWKKNKKEPQVALYNLLDTSSEFGRSNKWLERAKAEGKTSVDPIQLFASFNRSQSVLASRVNQINLILSILGSKRKATENPNFFRGCPTPIITKIIASRDSSYQLEIWDLFARIMSERFKGLRPGDFDNLSKWYGVNIASFTIFLFWVDSEQFMPLDQNTVTFLLGIGALPRIPKNYYDYSEICGYSDNDDLFREIVAMAYQVSLKGEGNVVFPSKLNGFISRFQRTEEAQKAISSIRYNFQLIAIRPFKTAQKHIKNLKNQIYQFYHSFKFEEDGKLIRYKEGIEDILYNSDDLKISISAIVGENGSGKSTITELLFLAINKLSRLKKIESEQELEDSEIYLDLYVKTDRLYKISVGNSIHVEMYGFDDTTKTYQDPKAISLDEFNFEQFFYSVVVNYSLFGLNSKILGKWLDPLFHKNDTYQVPIVLNPKRVEGNIDINTEEYLGKSRLLSNILERGIDWENENVEPIIGDKVPIQLEICFDFEKLKQARSKYTGAKKTQEEIINEIDNILAYLNINEIKALSFVKEIKEYIYYKLISIGIKYDSTYGEFVNIKEENAFKKGKLKHYINALWSDESHITFKLKQAINYLRFGHITFKRKKSSINLIEFAYLINELKLSSFERNDDSEKPLRTIELIPPSIFKTEIKFSNGSYFDMLSSGEKQKLLVINAITYHLVNIDSVHYHDHLLKYRYVNVILDEIELCFHPNMQREFISDLLSKIHQLDLEFISGLNLLFITHSPFILSDIPASNTIRLKNGEVDKEEPEQDTFGANIHELLANEFFFNNGFMGEFAKQRIASAIQFCKSKIDNTTYDLNFAWSEETVLEFINTIGEPLIQKSLKDLYYNAFGKNAIEKEIERLQSLL